MVTKLVFVLNTLTSEELLEAFTGRTDQSVPPSV